MNHYESEHAEFLKRRVGYQRDEVARAEMRVRLKMEADTSRSYRPLDRSDSEAGVAVPPALVDSQN